MCVQRFDDSLNSAIHTTYRISLRSSSMPEPRDPLLKVLIFVCFIRRLQVISGCFVVPIGRRACRGNGRYCKGKGVISTGPEPHDNDPSAGSPTETLLRLLLPLNDKVQWTSRDVGGGEPPPSPRSEHFTGPFNR